MSNQWLELYPHSEYDIALMKTQQQVLNNAAAMNIKGKMLNDLICHSINVALADKKSTITFIDSYGIKGPSNKYRKQLRRQLATAK
jgi:hypothetical protein